MAVFTYKGRDRSGDLVKGTLEGDDSGSIAEQLMNSGITPLEIAVSRAKAASATEKVSGSALDRLRHRLTDQPVTALDLMLFSRQMYTLLKAGVPILRALSGLQESTQKPAFAAVIKDLRESLDSGRELSSAMRRHPEVFFPYYLSMVQVGEMTGMLDDTFMRLYEHMEFEREINERIKTALRYPSFVIMAMGIAIVIINLFVIPAFAKVFAGFKSELPLMTKMLIGFSNFMVNYWMLLLALGVGAVVVFRAWINTPAGRYTWDRYKLRLPIAGKIIFKSTLARFARSLALSFKSGMPVLQGMDAVALVVDNAYMRSRVEEMRAGIERGESILRTAMAAGVFNPVVLQMIAVGEETGDLDGLMFEVADMYQREIEYEVKTLSSQIEPILIVFLGILVLILALGVFMPMWDLGKAAMHK
ncbi:MAG: MSHA biogenesis protein MshG [Gallionellales bacterium GWA2_60_142]|nr:MAG: MSHA biogenesis protein MshG [Gallionellales bacterium GWA2_60_142]HCI12639.1 MSHA biogenesis protein MshG [Gallionellaceae bacterium]